MPLTSRPEDRLADTADYWLTVEDTETICEAWAVDDWAAPQESPRLVYAGIIGPNAAVRRAAALLRRNDAPAHITSSDPAQWRTNLRVRMLHHGQTYRSSLPEAGLHHAVVMPAESVAESESRHRDRSPAVYYLFPETDAGLAAACGNVLRRRTPLLCPPQWNAELLQICIHLGMVAKLESVGVVAYALRPEAGVIQEAVSAAVAAGRLRLAAAA